MGHGRRRNTGQGDTISTSELLTPETAFNVRRVNSLCYMKTFMSLLNKVFIKPISSFKYTYFKPNKAADWLAGQIQS